MNDKEVNETILAAKRFLNANSPPKEKDITEVIQQAKNFLKQNNHPPEEKPYWVDHDGNLLEVPKGMFFDAKADRLKFKKVN